MKKVFEFVSIQSNSQNYQNSFRLIHIQTMYMISADVLFLFFKIKSRVSIKWP